MKKSLSSLLSIILVVLLVCSYPNQSLAKKKFNDISETFWAKDQIEQLANQGIISGFPDGSFKPTAQLTRLQVAIMLQRAKNYDMTNRPNPNLKDVSVNDKYYQTIATVIDEGVFEGLIKNNQFQPNNPVTRAEMAVILGNTYGFVDGNLENSFKDVPANHWASNAIKSLVATGVTSGYPDGTFRPNTPLTRAQFSVFLTRTLNYNEQKIQGPSQYIDWKDPDSSKFIAPIDEGETGDIYKPGYEGNIELQEPKGYKTYYVNGKLADDEAIEDLGHIYISLNIVVEGMGDSYSYNPSSRLSEVKKGNQSYYVGIGQTKAFDENFNSYPIAMKKVNGDLVPTDAHVFKMNDNVYVPIDFVRDILKYPVTIKNNVIYIGKIVTPQTEKKEEPKESKQPTQYYLGKYPLPEGWVKPEIKSTATKDHFKNAEILEKELGLYQGTVYGPSSILIGEAHHDGFDVILQFSSWYGGTDKEDYFFNTIPFIAEEIFQFYMPNNYKTMMEIMEIVGSVKQDTQGKYAHINYGETFKLGNNRVKLQKVNRSVQVLIDYK